MSSALRARSAMMVSASENALNPMPIIVLHSTGAAIGAISRPMVPDTPSTPRPTFHRLWWVLRAASGDSRSAIGTPMRDITPDMTPALVLSMPLSMKICGSQPIMT